MAEEPTWREREEWYLYLINDLLQEVNQLRTNMQMRTFKDIDIYVDYRRWYLNTEQV
jgi:hypothetical protein